ncbi:unnamed protein product [Lactuca saligna]|uniref:Uncharacterized protein n=1 Tax=Lactuca saligna TaxID=75948 RepID=A0AA35YXJ8_LACSI|nr:unnamed protein product [Lactuca saligna]
MSNKEQMRKKVGIRLKIPFCSIILHREEYAGNGSNRWRKRFLNSKSSSFASSHQRGGLGFIVTPLPPSMSVFYVDSSIIQNSGFYLCRGLGEGLSHWRSDGCHTFTQLLFILFQQLRGIKFGSTFIVITLLVVKSQLKEALLQMSFIIRGLFGLMKFKGAALLDGFGENVIQLKVDLLKFKSFHQNTSKDDKVQENKQVELNAK